MLTWLQLMRLPTVFTALADVLCGFLLASSVTTNTEVNWQVLPWLLFCSAGLYLSGMVFNDVFDARLDSIERPERPIPSGRVTIRGAVVLGTLLMAMGFFASLMAHSAAESAGQAPIVAAMIAIAVMTYNAVLKSTWLGPFSMAGCRFLNLVLGASATLAETGPVAAWQQPVLGAATGLGVYIVGVTWFARNEAGNASIQGLKGGLLVACVGVTMSAAMLLQHQTDTTIRIIAAVQFAIIVGITFRRGWQAIRNGTSPILQRTVGKMLLWIIVLDAVAVFTITGNPLYEILILLLAFPAIQLRKRIAMS